MKFVIQLHMQRYSRTDGGTTVLLYIAKSLHERGQQSWVRLPDNGYNYEDNIIYTNYFNDQHVDDDTTAIYIDCTIGNPLKAKRVVRLITYGSNWYPDYDTNEIIYYHAPFCKNNRPNKTLCMLYLNPLTKNLNLPRSGSCYIVKKGRYDPKVREAFSNKVIPSIDLDGKSIEEVVHILNTTRHFFCYDPCCFLFIMALICGCVVVQHPVTGCNEDEWMHTLGFSSVGRFKGLAYGYANIAWAESTITDAPEQCMKLINESQGHLDSFIKDMETGNYTYTPCYKFNESPYALTWFDRRI